MERRPARLSRHGGFVLETDGANSPLLQFQHQDVDKRAVLGGQRRGKGRSGTARRLLFNHGHAQLNAESAEGEARPFLQCLHAGVLP